MGLRTKFNLTLFIVFLLGLALTGAASYRSVQENVRDVVIQNARIMRESAQAIRDYTAQEIRPLLELQSSHQFLPHTVPSFAAQTNFRALQESFPQYSYKEAALNPTNLSDLANDWEAELIRSFIENPDLPEQIKVLDASEGKVLTLSRPIKVSQESCLQCHSTPDVAPASMVAIYGTENGFGWKLGDVIGAQIVSVPMQVAQERAERVFLIFMANTVGVFVVVFLILNLALHYLVIKRVVMISRTASEVSMGNFETPEVQARSRDEIGSLVQSINRLRRSLENAMKMIDD